MNFYEVVNPDCITDLDKILPYLMLTSFILGYLFLRTFTIDTKSLNSPKNEKLNYYITNNLIRNGDDDFDKEIN
jgi:hypothetical protein